MQILEISKKEKHFKNKHILARISVDTDVIGLGPKCGNTARLSPVQALEHLLAKESASKQPRTSCVKLGKKIAFVGQFRELVAQDPSLSLALANLQHRDNFLPL